MLNEPRIEKQEETDRDQKAHIVLDLILLGPVLH